MKRQQKPHQGTGAEKPSLSIVTRGAEAVANANQLTAECAFCGSIHIRPQSNEDLIKPESLIPFKIDKQTSLKKFKEWLKKRYFSPNDLKLLAKEEKVQGVYIPFWTFDADTNSFYTAEKGIYYYDFENVYVKDASGKGRYEKRRVRKPGGTLHQVRTGIYSMTS